MIHASSLQEAPPRIIQNIKAGFKSVASMGPKMGASTKKTGGLPAQPGGPSPLFRQCKNKVFHPVLSKNICSKDIGSGRVNLLSST